MNCSATPSSWTIACSRPVSWACGINDQDGACRREALHQSHARVDDHAILVDEAVDAEWGDTDGLVLGDNVKHLARRRRSQAALGDQQRVVRAAVRGADLTEGIRIGQVDVRCQDVDVRCGRFPQRNYVAHRPARGIVVACIAEAVLVQPHIDVERHVVDGPGRLGNGVDVACHMPNVEHLRRAPSEDLHLCTACPGPVLRPSLVQAGGGDGGQEGRDGRRRLRSE